MKYSQRLIDKIWDLSGEDMSVSKITKMQNLKNEQVRYAGAQFSSISLWICPGIRPYLYF